MVVAIQKVEIEKEVQVEKKKDEKEVVYSEKKPPYFVNEEFLYKLCVNCDTIRHISEFSRTVKTPKLIYTHRKCKNCRCKIECPKQKIKYHEKKKENAEQEL